MRQKCIVTIYYATYESTQTVCCDENDEIETIVAKARKQALPYGGWLPMAYESAKIISREFYNGE